MLSLTIERKILEKSNERSTQQLEKLSKQFQRNLAAKEVSIEVEVSEEHAEWLEEKFQLPGRPSQSDAVSQEKKMELALQQTKKELQHDGQDARQAKEELGTTLRNTKWRILSMESKDGRLTKVIEDLQRQLKAEKDELEEMRGTGSGMGGREKRRLKAKIALRANVCAIHLRRQVDEIEKELFRERVKCQENRRPKRNNFSGHRVHLQNNATQDNPVTAETEGPDATNCSKRGI
ncbi:unnamed protein product [Enterobius vermicularis]|uniref:SPATA1_C domain-containing protein n=1 Tax=Enterobius vermicularis TaxID=51028 RepID=A0A0N4V876_ENTVE|nr:unnamed protein product [Enterobius vermicularis]